MICSICGDECTDNLYAEVRTKVIRNDEPPREVETKICGPCLKWCDQLSEGAELLTKALQPAD